MSQMLERAAKAIREDMGPVFGGRLEARQQRVAEAHARLALLAALDPSDSGLAEIAGRGLFACAASVGVTHGDWGDLGTEAQASYVMMGQAAVAALKAHAVYTKEGEQ